MSEEQKNRNVPINIFYSYAQQDEALYNELEKHLSPLRSEGRIVEWSKREILAGSNWANELDQKLLSASLILLLISPDFLNSEDTYGTEMQRALERYNNGEVRVIPILLRPCSWRHTPLASLKCLPANAQPVTTWQDQDKAFQEIADEIRRVVEGMYAGTENSRSHQTFSPGNASYHSGIDLGDSPLKSSYGDADRLIYKYDIHADQPFSVDWSPDGARIASGSLDNTVHVWEAATGRHLRTYRHPRSIIPTAVYIVRWSSDSKYIASAGKAAHIHVWEATSGRDITTYDGHSSFLPGIYYLAWSPDAHYIVSANSTPTDDAFHIWNVSHGSRIMKLSLPIHLKFSLSIPGAVAWSDDGTRIAATWEKRLQIHNAHTGKQIQTYESLADRILNILWSSNDRYLIFTEGQKIIVWDTVTVTALHAYSAHTDTIREIALSHNGRYIASASEDRTVHIWELMTGKQIFVYRGHSDHVTSVTWSPDGTCIASACKDKSIHVWRTLLP